MKLDYIPHINGFGDNIIRLYDFNKQEAIKLRQHIQDIILAGKSELDLAEIDFIEMRNCSLKLCITNEDTGIITDDNLSFICNLTIGGYEQMVLLMEPFCNKTTKGYQYLYELDNQTDFLYSPAGTW